MSGTLHLNQVQLGDSATAANNFVLSVPAAPDGTVKLSRGNVGATTQDVLVVNADGGVKGGVAPAFSVYASVATSLVQNVLTKVAFQAKEFDTTNAFDAVTNSRFQPTVAGYYQLTSSVYMATAASYVFVHIYKNGVVAKKGLNASNLMSNGFVTALIYLNGTTDYVEIFCQQNAATQNCSIAQSETYFQGHLARAA